MNRTVLIVVVLVIVAAVGGYFYMNQNAGDAGGDAAAGAGATGATGEVPAAVQVAIDFCKEKGGTVETETIAEGVTHLCVMADGTKAEVSKYMADNKTE